MSMPSSDVRTPNCSLSRVWSAISAACSRAFVGMHPRCRHVPPTLSFSTIATERSSSAARRAAAYPPLPAPRMTTSYTFSPLPEVTVDSDTGAPSRFPASCLRAAATDAILSFPCHDRRSASRAPGTSREHRGTLARQNSIDDAPRRRAMGLFGRLRAGTAARSERRQELDDVRRHLEDFVRTRIGVEAFIEPRTTVTPPTVLLVASSGEWTRRRVEDPKIVQGLAEQLRVPVYDVRLVG